MVRALVKFVSAGNETKRPAHLFPDEPTPYVMIAALEPEVNRELTINSKIV